ncbi:hypothetical protein ACP0HM_05620 [Escherichia coli]
MIRRGYWRVTAPAMLSWKNIRQQLGLDQPLYVQFYRYVSDLFHGDPGTSIRTGRPVLEELRIFFSRRR